MVNNRFTEEEKKELESNKDDVIRYLKEKHPNKNGKELRSILGFAYREILSNDR